MKIVKIKPNNIKVPEVRVTGRFDEDSWRLFQEGYATTGQVAPILCIKVEDDIVLVDGLHRLQEAIRTGADSILVALDDGNMVDVLARNIFVDHLRGKHPPSEMMKVVEAMMREYNLDSEAIATKTGLKRDYVEKLLRISELTPMCRDALDRDLITVGHADALTLLKDPVKQETVLQQQLLYHWSVKDLREHISNIMVLVNAAPVAPTVGAPPAPVKIKCFYCHTDHEVAEIANPNTCQECAGVLLAAISQARLEVSRAEALPDGAGG